MPPLRVLHVSPYYEHAWAYGGIPRVVTAQVRGLAARGHVVMVCTTDAATADRRLNPTESALSASVDARVTIKAFRNLSNHAAYHWQFFLPRGLGSFLRAHVCDFDVAHLHACHNVPTALAARACRVAGVPYIVSPHGTAPRLERRVFAKRIFDLTLGRRVLTDATYVSAVSQAEREQLRSSGVADGRVVQVLNPIELEPFSRPIVRGRFRHAVNLGPEPVVMFFGKLTPRKRLGDLARAFHRLGHATARLVIAGNDMGIEAELRKLLQQLGIADRTIFTGLLSGSARFEALADADVVVYPSTDEVFGLVPIESLLAGTPVIVAGDSGCGEMIRKFGGGLVVPPRNPAALARALQAVLSAPDAWCAAAKSAADRVRTWCNPSAVCAVLETVYRDAIRLNRRASRS